MPRKATPLTDSAIKVAKPKDSPYKLTDGQGLYLEVTPNGSKLWRLKYRFDGKEKRLALGAYPAVSLQQARQRRTEARELLAQGGDPSAEKKAAKQDHRAAEWESVRRVMLGYGRLILLDRDGIADALGFDALADLLNINRADREKAHREGWRTLSDLVGVHDLENSSERRSDEWGAGSPLYEAAFLAMVEFIHSTPTHLLPDPFAPGAPFGPKLPPVLRVV